jgi:hypothetical protein
MDKSGKIGVSDQVDQVTIHATVITLDTLRADGNAAGEIRFTFELPGEVDQDGNPRTPPVPETVSLGPLLMQLRDEIDLLKFKVAQLESKV